MGIPTCFVLFLIFLAVFNIKLNKNSIESNSAKKKYYEEEIKALSVRKKTLNNLDFIKLNTEKLPILNEKDLVNDTDKEIYEKQSLVLEISDKPMVSFRNETNLDLKLKYGVANLNTLIEYEANYNELLIQLVKWAELYFEIDKLNEAKTILEEGINLHTDISNNYILLGKIYIEQKNYNAFNNLKLTVKNSSMPFKEKILEKFISLVF